MKFKMCEADEADDADEAEKSAKNCRLRVKNCRFTGFLREFFEFALMVTGRFNHGWGGETFLRELREFSLIGTGKLGRGENAKAMMGSLFGWMWVIARRLADRQVRPTRV
jgi:hypothetical protein